MHHKKMQQIIEASFNSKMWIITIVRNKYVCILWNNNNGESKKQTNLEYLRSKCFRSYLFIQSEPKAAEFRGLELGLLIACAMVIIRKTVLYLASSQWAK